MKRFINKKCLVVGGAGFIGSHIVDALINEGAKVFVVDNFSTGKSINERAEYFSIDIRDFSLLTVYFIGMDYVFHTAAIARTPWCINDPLLCYSVNVMGTLNILESARKHKVGRVVLSSSNVVYAFDTPYRTSKEAVERLGDVYVKMYGQSVISLRYSNVYGKRQSEDGVSPNVFAALRKSRKEKGYLEITGDGEQSRDYTHVSDIAEGNLLAALSDYCGVLDLCTGVNTSLNEVSKYFNCPIKYIDERPGDIKHIYQHWWRAWEYIKFKAKVKLEDGIKDVLEDEAYAKV